MLTFGRRSSLHLATAVAALLPLSVGLTGCDDSGSPNVNTQAAQYIIPTDEPGTPYPQAADAIEVSNNTKFTVSLNQVTDLEVDPTTNEILHGKQTFKSKNWVKAQALRVEKYAEPPSTKIVQVNVGLDGPLPLKSLRETKKGVFAPGPVLGDDIGNFYWPIGYKLTTKTGDTSTTIMLDPANPMKDLRDLPPMSRSRPAELTLVYRVNEGVTINSFSYGGKEKLTFAIPVTDR